MTAIDMLTLLTEVAPEMMVSLPSVPARVLHHLCHSVAEFMTHSELKKTSWATKVSGLRERERERERDEGEHDHWVLSFDPNGKLAVPFL